MSSHLLADPNAYSSLVNHFPLIPIRNERHLEQAIAVIDELIDKNDLTAEEDAYLEVLSDLVEKFEEQRFRIEPMAPAEALRYLMEANGLKQADLAHLFSSRSNLSDVLAGRRQLSKAQIVRLASYFRVSPELFLDQPAPKTRFHKGRRGAVKPKTLKYGSASSSARGRTRRDK